MKEVSPKHFYLALLAVLLVRASVAQESKIYRAAFENNEKAHDILDLCLNSHGGIVELEALETLSVDFKGQWAAPFNNMYPDFTKLMHPREGFFTVDYSKGWLNYEEQYERPGVWTSWHRYIIKGDSAYDVNLSHQTYRPESSGWIRRWALQLPPDILLDAKKNSRTLRFLGSSVDQKYFLLNYRSDNSRSYTLYIERETYLLKKREAVSNTIFLGDVSVLYEFEDFKRVGTLMLPHRYQRKLNGMLRDDHVFANYRINESYREDLFVIPDNLTYHDWSQPNGNSSQLVKHANGIHALENVAGTRYKVLIVEFREYFLILGAPRRSVNEILNTLEEIAPDKKVRYVVPLNHGYTQMIGIRDYVAKDIPVMSSLGNKAFIEQQIEASHRVRPDALEQSPRSLQLSTIDGEQMVFKDGSLEMHLVQIGPTPKYADMLVAYFPKEKILFQDNMYAVEDFDGKGTLSAIDADEVTVYLHDVIKKKGWDVDKIICGEGRDITMEEFQWAIDNYQPDRQKMRPFDLYRKP